MKPGDPGYFDGIEAELLADALGLSLEKIEEMCAEGAIAAHECMEEWLIDSEAFNSLVALKLAHDSIDTLEQAKKQLRTAFSISLINESIFSFESGIEADALFYQIDELQEMLKKMLNPLPWKADAD